MTAPGAPWTPCPDRHRESLGEGTGWIQPLARTKASPDMAFSQGDGRWMDRAPRPQGHSGASNAFRKSSNSREQRAGRRPGLRHSGKAMGIQNSSPSRARTGPKWAKGPLLSGEGRTPGHWGASVSWSCGGVPPSPREEGRVERSAQDSRGRGQLPTPGHRGRPGLQERRAS